MAGHQKSLIKKKKKFRGCWGEFARGIFFARVLPSLVCVFLLLALSHSDSFDLDSFSKDSLNTTEIFSIRILRSADLETSWPIIHQQTKVHLIWVLILRFVLYLHHITNLTPSIHNHLESSALIFVHGKSCIIRKAISPSIHWTLNCFLDYYHVWQFVNFGNPIEYVCIHSLSIYYCL